MWARIHRLLLQQIHVDKGAPEYSMAAFALELLEALCAIQSEPVDAMPDAEYMIGRFMTDGEGFAALAERIREGARLSELDLLTMTFLADVVLQLDSQWDGYYAPAFSSHPETGGRVASVRAGLRIMPFGELLRTLNEGWRADEDALRGAIFSVYVTTCAENGVYGEDRLYENVLKRLVFFKPFVPTVVCAYCVKRLTLRRLIDARDMTKEQYECMALLDNFYAGPEGAWG